MTDDLISRKAALEALGECPENWEDSPEEIEAVNSWLRAAEAINSVYAVPAVPLEPLCELLAEMYHCPGSGWPSSNRACHPNCPDEVFEKLCGTDCDNYTDAERWKAFLEHWMEEQNATD